MAKDDGRKALGIMLDRIDLEHLQEGYCIHFNAEEMDRSKLDMQEVIIEFRETLEEGLQALQCNMNSNTLVRDDSPTKH